MTITAYDRVKTARGLGRPTGADCIRGVFRSFMELHGDRRFGDDPAVVGGLAELNGRPVTVIAIERGHDLNERMRRRFGSPEPEGYRKAVRLMKQAEKFHRPVVCFVDTSGAYPGIGAEQRGQGQAIAESLMEMIGLRTPVISVIIGEGGSGGALALAAADRVWMLENAVYSVISPEGCASILWKDAARAPEAAESLRLTAQDSLRGGLIEAVIPEESLGEKPFFDALGRRIADELEGLGRLSLQELTEQRYRRFRRIGAGE